jgi:hypothetical protein
MALSKSQQKRDRGEAVVARRQTADILKDIMPAIEKAQAKLAYNKSSAELFQLKNITMELRELIEMLKDPENDPVD